MKVAIIGDIHIGSRNDNLRFAEFHISFFTKLLIPYLIKHNINRAIFMGDIFDRRKFINFTTLDKWKNEVFDLFYRHKITLDIIIGNHDTAFKNSNEVNSPSLLLSEYDNIRIFSGPEVVFLDNTEVLYVPWINIGNETETFDLVKKTKATVAMGHFEFSGFQMYADHKNEDGMTKEKFKNFEMILSGHYHHKSDDGQIFYVGTPYEIIWSDFGSPHGFHILDSDSLELAYIENPNRMFYRTVYDDSSDEDYHNKIDYTIFCDKFVKVVVLSKTNLSGFDTFLNKLYNKNPAEVKIIEDMQDFNKDQDEEESNIELEDTQSILDSYIDAADFSHDKSRLKKMIRGLYLDALNVESV